ncbi:hypothetical protein LQ383_17475, partial [Rhodococcus ruber]
MKITYAVFDARNGARRSASATGAPDNADRSAVSIARVRTDPSPGTSNPSRPVVSTTTGAA